MMCGDGAEYNKIWLSIVGRTGLLFKIGAEDA